MSKRTFKRFSLVIALIGHFVFSGNGQENKKHTPFLEDGWLSCSRSVNPNADRPMSHWLLYDFGTEYSLDTTYIWNYNTWGADGQGAKDVVIDYSSDGEHWTSWGTTQFERASGSYKYKGFRGPVLEGIRARYVLLTFLNNWDGSGCTGVAEMRFNLLDQTTATEDVLAGGTIDLSPNPTSGFVRATVISAEKLQDIRILDITGKTILMVRSLGEEYVEFNLSDFPPGVYTARFRFPRGIASQKIVKVE